MEQITTPKRVIPDVNVGTQVLLGILFACVTLFWGTQKWKNRHLSKLASMFPGPMALPIIGNALEFLNSEPEDILSSMYRLGQNYKSPFRFWLGNRLCIQVSKPADLQIVLNNSKTLGKDEVYKFLQAVIGTGLIAAPVEKWKKTRKMLTPSFIPKKLERFEHIMNERANVLVQKIQEHSNSGHEINIYPYFLSASLDTFCGEHSNQLLSIVRFQNLSRASELGAARIYKPWLHLDWIYERTSYAKKLNEEGEALRGFAKNASILNNVIRECKMRLMKTKDSDIDNDNNNNKRSHSDDEDEKEHLLDVIFESREGVFFNYSETDMIDEVITFLIGGSETSAVTNCFCLLMLAMHPEFQEKVYEEQCNIFKGEDRPVTGEDMDRMEYTEQVIKETLRMFPVVPLILRAVEEDLKITENYVLPAGAAVVIAPLQTHSDPALWQEPEKFNPDNFSAENVQSRHKYAYIPFSGGARGCIGYRYALKAMKTTISTFIRHYRVSTITKLEDIKLCADLLVRSKDGWNMKLEPRIGTNPE
ncbi:cytochrome P450 4C1 [Bemisia tabaci]|uniref:cytochrome P450 4C1 n=1 Tax=Bemisia tabaci TaxID=7038 RepID=UPI003B28BC33